MFALDSNRAVQTNNNQHRNVIELRPLEINGVLYISLYPTNTGLIGAILELELAYHEEAGVYIIPDGLESLNTLFAHFKGRAWLDLTELQVARTHRKLGQERDLKRLDISPHHNSDYQRFVEYLDAKGYSKNTKLIYGHMVKVFLTYFRECEIAEISNDMVKEFLSKEVVAQNYSRAYQRQMIGSIKAFYRDRLNVRLDIEQLPMLKKEKKLPKVLNKDEVRRILEVTINLKHQVILMLLYGCGLRVSELIGLELKHIDSNIQTLLILNSKGNADRNIPVTENILEELRGYYKRYRPKKYLIEGMKRGEPYSARSINMVLKRSAARAGIHKRVHAHMLRHSYATHLLESDVDIRYIQVLLGHKSSRTTEIYTFVSNQKLGEIPNPFDNLFDK